MKNILVTGGAGFIGSNFVKYILKFDDYNILNLDDLTYAGNLYNLVDIEGSPKYKFIKGNVCDKNLVKEIFNKYDIDTIVNFAAESHVDRSIEEPSIFVETNILGTQNLLDIAKKYWQIKNSDKIEYRKGVKFLQVSTDEVYGTLGKDGYFTENTNLAPNSPYSASKTGADLIVRAYSETFNLPINITRCSNNYGPYQFPEKLIPLMINNCINDNGLPVYGDGMQIRDWLHVYDHCTALYTVLTKGKVGEIYNIGGNNEKTNLEIVKTIIKYLSKSENLIKYVTDRLGHDRRYAIDNTKITSELGWKPIYNFDEGIKDTIDWYLANKEWLENIISKKYINNNKNHSTNKC